MKTLKILTFNAAILDIQLLGYSIYQPVGFINDRLVKLIEKLEKIDADIVFLQELFHPRYQRILFHSLKHIYPHVMGLCNYNLSLRLGNELLILSNLPLSNGKLTRYSHAPPEELRHTSKGYYSCTFSIPGHKPVQLVNYHVSAGGKNAHPESPEMEFVRSLQIQQILNSFETNKNILLVGDLNAGPHSSTNNYQQILDAKFIDAFANAKPQDITWDPDNPLVQLGIEAHLPPQRIDHIFMNEQLTASLRPTNTKIILDEKILDSKVGKIPLSDHYGVFSVMEFT